MILVDSSVWIDHLRRPQERLLTLLDDDMVITHTFIIGEIALGHVRERGRMIAFLELLRRAVEPRGNEMLEFIRRHRLFGRGLGYVDVNLLLSAVLTPNARLWSEDKALRQAAKDLSVGFEP
ncbi:MAG TPA: VapC toxin family PIN domain ribonuclease [Xanthobacteraceae bacterium]|nr:VapC toxin family PIN domain ribonuclease [Xanthobacteraceae bacterium]